MGQAVNFRWERNVFEFAHEPVIQYGSDINTLIINTIDGAEGN